MPKPPVTLTQAYEELKQKAERVRSKNDTLIGKVEQLKRQRESYIESLKKHGIKNPENAEARRQAFAKRKADLMDKIKKETEALDEELDRLEQAEGKIEA